MQNKYISSLFSGVRIFSLNNISIFLMGCVILISQLYWFGSAVLKTEDINYENTQLLNELEYQDIDIIPAHFRVSADRKSILIVSDSETELYKLQIGSKILNFQLNNNGSILAVSVSDLKGALLIYDVKTLKIMKKIALERFPRFLEFSKDNRFLIVGDEHTTEIIRVELKNSRQITLALPILPLALISGQKPGELFVIAEMEVLKIQLDPLNLLERNASIEFAFGEETILADPNEFCTAHGVPHPLFTPIEEAMSTAGIKGYYFQSN